MRKRLLRGLIPGALLLCVFVLTVWAYVRGTWASTIPHDPATIEEGPICEVVQTPQGQKYVRASIRLPYAREEVWEVITDYEHFGDICPYIRSPSLEYDPNRTTEIEADVTTSLGGTLPLAVTLHQEQHLDRAICTWDEPTGKVLVNRGRWEVTGVNAHESILVVTLEVQMSHIPTFLLRNVSLHRLRRVVLAVEHRLRTGSEGQPW